MLPTAARPGPTLSDLRPEWEVWPGALMLSGVPRAQLLVKFSWRRFFSSSPPPASPECPFSTGPLTGPHVSGQGQAWVSVKWADSAGGSAAAAGCTVAAGPLYWFG